MLVSRLAHRWQSRRPYRAALGRKSLEREADCRHCACGIAVDADSVPDKLDKSSDNYQRFLTVGSSMDQTSDWTHETECQCGCGDKICPGVVGPWLDDVDVRGEVVVPGG
jgi:hypothetical protein